MKKQMAALMSLLFFGSPALAEKVEQVVCDPIEEIGTRETFTVTSDGLYLYPDDNMAFLKLGESKTAKEVIKIIKSKSYSGLQDLSLKGTYRSPRADETVEGQVSFEAYEEDISGRPVFKILIDDAEALVDCGPRLDGSMSNL